MSLPSRCFAKRCNHLNPDIRIGSCRNVLLPWDASLLDHVAPLPAVAIHALPHFFRCGSARIDAQDTEPFLQIR